MSRCFPYPPPGYEKSFALVESIKLQKEREKVKQERKKEKKREKKQKEKSRGEREKPEDKRRSHRKRHYEELSQWTYKSGGDYVKTREGESEQLEKSSLTEEQGCPAATVNFCDSSDSTQNSSKRIKHESVEVGRTTFGLASIQNFCDSFDSTQNSSKRLDEHESAQVCRTPHGNGFRIRLPLSRHKDLEPPSSSEQPCVSERTQVVSAQPDTSVFRLHQPPSSAEQPCFSGRNDATAPTDSHRTTDHKSASSEARRTHRSNHRRHDCCDTRRVYKKLLLDWSPPPPQMENPGVDDQDWLFGKTSGRQRVQGETRDQAANEDSGLGAALCSWPPRACFWPEVGVHALPYAVPF